MFYFHEKIQKGEIYFHFSSNINFNLTFQDEISRILNLSLFNDKFIVKNVFFICDEQTIFEKICLAHLSNTMFYINNYLNVSWNNCLRSKITSGIVIAKNFTCIDKDCTYVNREFMYYNFSTDSDLKEPVDKISLMLNRKKLTVSGYNTKEFLSTTIGEVFSNCINHNENCSFFFIYDIIEKEEDTFLFVNTVSYGCTIPENIRKYLGHSDRHYNFQRINSRDCIKWATKSGNTTRYGSGGYGLPTLISYIKKADGELNLLSEKAMYILNDNREDYVDISGIFPGTSISFKIKLLDNKSDDTERRASNLKSISLDQL